MNKLLAVLIFFSLFACDKRKETNIERIVVYSVNLDIDTSADVNCKDFELTFGDVIKVRTIKDKSVLNELDTFLKRIKKNDQNNSVDVRKKILIFHKDNIIDTLCVGRFSVVFNNQVIEKNEDLLEYALDL